MKYVTLKTGEITTYYVAGEVLKTRFYGSNYDPKTDRNCSGNIEIHFRDGRTSEILGVFPSEYQISISGLAISPERKLLFRPGWEHGIMAYSTENGMRIWKSKVGRCRNIICYDTCIIALSGDKALFQISLEDGSILRKISTEHGYTELFDISPSFCLVSVSENEYGIVKKSTLEIVQKINKRLWREQVGNMDMFTDGYKFFVLWRGYIPQISKWITGGYTVDADLNEEIKSNCDEKTVEERKKLIKSLYGVEFG